MAKVTKTDPVVETVVVQEASVVLELSPEEAVALMAVLGKVGGSLDTSPRGLVQNIFDGLDSAGVSYWGTEIKEALSGSLWFASPEDDE